jgi:ADP-ribose pyrophosphatase YjhB (NUDIX family)
MNTTPDPINEPTAELLATLRANRTAALSADPAAAAVAALMEVWREANRVLADDGESDHAGLESARDKVADVLRLLGAELPAVEVLDVDDPAFDDVMAGRPGEVTALPPAAAVPEEKRPWATAFYGYAPLDITPPELLPEGLAVSVAEGWAEPYATWADVPDWPERQARALIPFHLDEEGRPLNPIGRTGRTGRNLGKWGENAAVDPIVVVGTGADRRVLLIRRADRGVWAIPGGMVEPGESALQAQARELREETGVELDDAQLELWWTQYVDDWRASDHAWVVTTAALYRLSDEVEPVFGDDAVDAGWWPMPDLNTLAAALAPVGGLYGAHRRLLEFVLNDLTKTEA